MPDLLSWLQSFSLHAAVVGTHYPSKASELLAYQALMITEHRRCRGRGWLLHDTAFYQQISSIEKADFSELNQSLYLTTFVAHGGSCVHSLSQDHLQECALHPQKPVAVSPRKEDRREPGRWLEGKGRLKQKGGDAGGAGASNWTPREGRGGAHPDQ